MPHPPLSTIAALVACIAGLGVLLDAIETIRGRERLRMFFDATCNTAAPGMGRWSVTSGKMIAFLLGHVVVAAVTIFLLYIGSRYAAIGAMMVCAARWKITMRYVESQSSAERLQMVIWVTLALFALAGSGSPAQMAAMGFLALNGVVGYLMAGVTKFKSAHWLDGSAIKHVVLSDQFGSPKLAAVIPIGLWSVPLTWGTLAFEVGGPLVALTGPNAALCFFAAGIVFHVCISLLTGITQFVFSFGATYPAIYVSVVRLHEHLL